MRKPALPCREGYDRLAATYRSEHPFLDSFDWPPTVRLLRTHLRDRRTVLDAGCGDGRVLRRLAKEFPGARLVGLDLSMGMLRRLRRNSPDLPLVQGDILAPPFRPASFDAVLAFFLLVHIADPSLLFRSVARLLRRDGVLVCNTIPQRDVPVLGRGHDRFVIPAWDHSFRSVASAAGRAGFVLLDSVAVEQKGVPVSTVCVFLWPYPPAPS